MTDLCWNELKIVGRAADLDALLSRVRSGPDGVGGTQFLLLESLAPCPTPLIVLTEAEEAAETQPQPTHPSLEEQIRRWGVKWGDMEAEIQRRTSRSLTFGFSTPWAAPLMGIGAIARDYPHLRFRLSARGPDGDRMRARWEYGDRIAGLTQEIMPGLTIERFVLDLLMSADAATFIKDLSAQLAASAIGATELPTMQRLAA